MREKRRHLANSVTPYAFQQTASRVVAYLAFLSLFERAFADDGPIRVLTEQGEKRFELMNRDAVFAFEELRRARHNMVLGRTAARWSLANAAEALNKVSPTELRLTETST